MNDINFIIDRLFLKIQWLRSLGQLKMEQEWWNWILESQRTVYRLLCTIGFSHLKFSKLLISLVDRMMEGTGVVEEMTFKEIRSLKYKTVSKESESKQQDCPKESYQKYLNHPVPTVEEVILLCKARNCKLMIEIKTDCKLIVEKCVELIQKHSFHEDCYIAGFNPMVIFWTRCLDKEVETCLLFKNGWLNSWVTSKHEVFPIWLEYTACIIDPILTFLCFNVLPYILGVGIVGIHNVLISENLVSSYLNSGIVTDVWVVNKQTEMSWLFSQNVIITTDTLFQEFSNLQKINGGKSSSN